MTEKLKREVLMMCLVSVVGNGADTFNLDPKTIPKQWYLALRVVPEPQSNALTDTSFIVANFPFKASVIKFKK
jgi:hypothetical protein